VSVSFLPHSLTPPPLLTLTHSPGTFRTEDGGLLPEAGALPELDAVVHSASAVDSPALLSALTAAAALLPPRDMTAPHRHPDMTASYLRTAEKLLLLRRERERESRQEEGEGGSAAWLAGEVRRLEGAALQEDLDLDERDDLCLTANVSGGTCNGWNISALRMYS
jgi:hypothetical protein